MSDMTIRLLGIHGARDDEIGFGVSIQCESSTGLGKHHGTSCLGAADNGRGAVRIVATFRQSYDGSDTDAETMKELHLRRNDDALNVT